MWYTNVVHIKDGRVAEGSRIPYTAEQLNAIFGSSFYQEAVKNNWHLHPNILEQKHADMFWIPLISLYTGARMNEICQLEVADVTEEKGIPCFQITTEGDDDNKKLKNYTSRRTVPIHQKLIAVGLMEYVDYIRSKGQTRLFYDLKTGATGKYSDLFTKRFAYHLKKYDLKYPKKDFHSFRHTYRDECREQEIPDSVAEAIGGWSGGKNEADKYGVGLSLSKINDYLQKLQYDGLEPSQLSKIKYDSRCRNISMNFEHVTLSV